MEPQRVAVIVVARAGSTRLPGKMMEALGDGTVLSCALKRYQAIKRADEIILATTVSPADDALAKEAGALGIRVVRGSENDVVDRMLQAVDALEVPCDVLVRACADNPLFMPSIVDAAVDDLIESGCDMVTPFEYATLPFGYGLVVMTSRCLRKIDKEATQLSYREHVENYCLENPDRFHVRYQVAPDALAWPELCATLDFDVDLLRLRHMGKLLEGVPIKEQPEALIRSLKSQRVWVEGRDSGSPADHDLILLTSELPGLQAPSGVLVVDYFLVGEDYSYGLRYTESSPDGFPAGPVYLDESGIIHASAQEFLLANIEQVLPLLLAAPARTIDLLEFAAPPIEKRVHGERRRGFNNALEESFPIQVVLDHAEHSPQLLEDLLDELESHDQTDLFLPDCSPAELAQAIERLGDERVHDESPQANPFRVLNVIGDGHLGIQGASESIWNSSLAAFWRSTKARSARAKVLNQETRE